MTTTTDNATNPNTVFTARRASQLMTAVRVLKAIKDESQAAAWNAPTGLNSDVRAQDWGRISGKAETVEDALVDLLISAEVYLRLPNLRGGDD